jgi:hypothetical protein
MPAMPRIDRSAHIPNRCPQRRYGKPEPVVGASRTESSWDAPSKTILDIEP